MRLAAGSVVCRFGVFSGLVTLMVMVYRLKVPLKQSSLTSMPLLPFFIQVP